MVRVYTYLDVQGFLFSLDMYQEAQRSAIRCSNSYRRRFLWPNRTVSSHQYIYYLFMRVQECTLDILMHLPRSAFSHKQLDLFLWILQINNIDHVPSVKSMQSLNEALQKLCGIDTLRCDGALGHTYYVNSLADIIAQVRGSLRLD